MSDLIKVHESIGNRRTLTVNGYVVGSYIYGEKKDYEDPTKWAKKQVPKRLAVCSRNMSRLQKELDDWTRESNALHIAKSQLDRE